MRKLNDSELRHQLKRGLQQLPRSVLADLAASPIRREKALEEATDVLLVRFNGCDVVGPEPLKGPGAIKR